MMRKTSQRMLAITLTILMICAMFPAAVAYAAEPEYGWQGIGENGETKINKIKMLDPLPSDIRVLHTASDKNDSFINEIRTPVSGKAGLRLVFTMDSGMSSFGSGENFRKNCMPHIKIWDENEKNIVASYESGTLKFYAGDSHGADKTTGDEGRISIGTEKGLLPSGNYVIVFGAEVCGNNPNKILGAPVKFKFYLESIPPLNELIQEAETVKDSAVIYEDAAADRDRWGKYSKQSAEALQKAIDLAKTGNGGDAEAKTLYDALQTFKASVTVGISSVSIKNFAEPLQVGDTGIAEADVVSIPSDKKYQTVTWSVTPKDGCLSIDSDTGEWTANYPGKAELTAAAKGTSGQKISQKKEVTVAAPAAGGVSVNLSKGGTLRETVSKAGSGSGSITSLKVTTSKGAALQQADFDYIKSLSSLTSLDLFNCQCGDVDFKGNKKLEKIVLPKTLARIKSQAFADCTNLKDIEIPASVTELGSGAFKNCISLPETIKVWSIEPPGYVQDAGAMEDVFKGTQVRAIQVPYGCSEDYEAADSWKKYKIREAEERELSVTAVKSGQLEKSAFSALRKKGLDESQIDRINIETAEGAWLTRSEDISWLQKNCLNAATIDLSCAKLEDDKIKANYFKDRTGLKTIYLPAEISNFGDSVFAGCRNLSEITLPEGLQSIGKNAFQDCTSLSDTIVCNAATPPEYSGMLFPTGDKTILVPQQSVSAYKQHTGWGQYKIASQMSLSLSAKSLSIEVATGKKLTAAVTSHDGYEPSIRWSTSNSSIVTVDQNGQIWGRKPGKAVITAKVLSSGASASCTVTVKALPAPHVKGASVSYNSARVSWSAVKGAAGYEVYRASKKTGAYTKLRTLSASVRNYTDTGRSTGTSYYYKVRAYKTAGGTRYAGDYSAMVTVKPVPAKVSGVKAAKSGSKKIKVSWKRTSGASGYTVSQSLKKSSGYKTVKTIKGGGTVKYTSGNLKKGKQYYYKVRAYRTVKGKKIYGPYSSVVFCKVK